MPVYSVEVEKRLASEFWVNRYLVLGANLGDALSVANGIVEVELTFHSPLVQFTRYRASDITIGSEIYAIVPIGQNGERGSGGALLPLFNVLRVDFTAATGRPSRKYYRGVLTEADINGSAVETDFSSLVGPMSLYFKGAEDPFGIIDPQGQQLTAVVPYDQVGMRQLRRGRRRRQGLGIFE